MASAMEAKMSTGVKGKVCIAGSGIVGRSWAVLFARAGYSVALYDVEPNQVAQAIVDIRQAKLPALAELNMLNGQSIDAIMQNISACSSLVDGLQSAVYFQECIPEVLAMKQAFFLQVDAAVTATKNDAVVLASSTSNLAASSFTEGMKHRSQCIVAHPVNPPFAIPLVELVQSPWTDPQITAKARSILLDIGQSPIVLKKEVDGFVLNRLQYALLAEAFRLVEDGVCDPADVDTAVNSGLGLRWAFLGPFETIDLNAPGGVVDYCERYAPAILRVVRTQDNSRDWKPEMIAKIDAAMREQVPKEDMAARIAWRNDRLLQLAAMKQSLKKTE